MGELNPNISTTLNVNVISAPIKRPRLSKWIKIHH